MIHHYIFTFYYCVCRVVLKKIKKGPPQKISECGPVLGLSPLSSLARV